MALRRKFTQTKFFRALVVLGLLGACLFFQPRFILEPLRSVIAVISSPVEGIVSALGFEVRDAFHFFSSIGELKTENERLQKDNIRLSSENSKWESVSGENEELRKQLGLLPQQKHDLLSAEVVGRDASGIGNWITINRGALDDIRQGMPVIVNGEVLVGRVSEVFASSSRIMLLSHPESQISGITTTGEAQGI